MPWLCRGGARGGFSPSPVGPQLLPRHSPPPLLHRVRNAEELCWPFGAVYLFNGGTTVPTRCGWGPSVLPLWPRACRPRTIPAPRPFCGAAGSRLMRGTFGLPSWCPCHTRYLWPGCLDGTESEDRAWGSQGLSWL